ncbi:MAG: hypothetical protein QOE45_2507 [Frankiaceae bacterium]|nr:hypothetical protein [Frankiaceae bacterium]
MQDDVAAADAAHELLARRWPDAVLVGDLTDLDERLAQSHRAPDPLDIVIGRERRTLIALTFLRAFRQLTPVQRQVIADRKIRHLDYASIARRRGLSEAAARKHYQRGTEKLGELLGRIVVPVIVFLIVLSLVVTMLGIGRHLTPVRPFPIFPRTGLGLRHLDLPPCDDPAKIDSGTPASQEQDLDLSLPTVLTDDFGGRGSWSSTFQLSVRDRKTGDLISNGDISAHAWLLTPDALNVVADGLTGSFGDQQQILLTGSPCRSRSTGSSIEPHAGSYILQISASRRRSYCCAPPVRQLVTYGLGRIPEPTLPSLNAASCKLDTEPALIYIRLQANAPERYHIIPPLHAVSGRTATFIVAFMPKIDDSLPDPHLYPGLAAMVEGRDVHPRTWLYMPVIVPLRSCSEGRFTAPVPPGRYSATFLYDSALGIHDPLNPWRSQLELRSVSTSEYPWSPPRTIFTVQGE